MTVLQIRLMNAYATMVMGNRMTLEEIPETPLKLADGTDSTMRKEVEFEVARRTIEILG